MDIEFRYAARSDIGLTRANNQDSAYAGPHLLVVADGMGGHAGGDIASSVAIAHLAPLDEENPPADEAADRLTAAVDNAHEELLDLVVEDPELAGLGTTVTALLRSGNRLVIGHIGDSRAYLLRDGEFELVTTDHSFVHYLVESGKLAPEQAEHHPQRSLLLRVLGDVDLDGGIDISVRELKPGDRWLLCSDGLSSVVAADTLEKTVSSITEPGACADHLIDLALRGGGPDNVTCIVADVVDSSTLTSEQAPDTHVHVVGAAALDRGHHTRGTSGAAGKAAALAASTKPPESDELKDERKPSRVGRRVTIAIISTVVAVGLVIGGIFGYSWTQSQYYLGEYAGQVAIFKGVNQNIGPLHLSHMYTLTGIKISSLPDVNRQRLEKTIPATSMNDAMDKLSAFEQEAGVTQ